MQVAEVLAIAGSLKGLAHILQRAHEHLHVAVSLAVEVSWLLAHLLTAEDRINKGVAAGVLQPLLALLHAATLQVAGCTLADACCHGYRSVLA